MMAWRIVQRVLLVLLLTGIAQVQARELYFVDAHSQFDQDVEADLILDRMDEANVYKTILATRRKRKAEEAADLAEQHPARIVASLRTKGRPYSEDSNKFYKKLEQSVGSGRFAAMAEVLVFHAQKGNKADEVRVSMDDARVQAALKAAIGEGWPFVVHIEFASLAGADRDDYMAGLKAMLSTNPDHPIALIHMGQLPPSDAAALIEDHPNVYFLTSHADPVSAESNQPWIDMMEGEGFTPAWRELITRHPARFVFALDNVWDWQWRDTYLEHVELWRSALEALPEDVAHAVAHGNAERLWRLPAKP